MNIGIVLENHRWFNILEEVYKAYSPKRIQVYNMDHDFMSFSTGGNTVWVTIAMGASIAVSMAEKLIHDFECKKIIRIGTAGSLVDDIMIGDVAITYAGIKGEGTSVYYIEQEVPAVGRINSVYGFNEILTTRGITSHMVITFTTDGRWKENGVKLNKYKEVGAQTIDMESSALLSMGMEQKIDLLSMSIITDSPLEDEEEFMGLIHEGVWDKVMKKFIELFTVCLEWSERQ